MTVSAASKLDIEKFRKVHGLMKGGATEGERSAAKARAEAMAAKAGMTLKQAVSSLDSKPQAQPPNFFEGFDDWCEAREPGWKAKRAAEKAARDARDAVRKAAILAECGTEKQLFARNERERALAAAIAPFVTAWEYWEEEDGTRHHYAEQIDGKRMRGVYWHVADISVAARDAIRNAYPWPAQLSDALIEARQWDKLRLDRGLINGGEWTHYAEVECRIDMLEKALNGEQPATSWEDVQARFDWKRWEFERQWIDPTKRDDPFMDRLEADVAELRRTNPILSDLLEGCSQSEHPSQAVQNGQGGEVEGYVQSVYPLPRTNARKRDAVLSMLDTHPDLSDREIARRVGVSPQTVNTWRKKRAAA